MRLLFMYPGQGGQQVGMLHRLPPHPAITVTFQQASEILGRPCLELDCAASLASTIGVQLCLLISGVAMTRFFAAAGIVPDMVAGLSIGAFPAAVAAGVIEFSDALRLVLRRARLMQQSYPEGYGMAAIIGLDRAQLDALIAAHHSEQAPVYLANLNGPRQLVIAGSNAALAAVMSAALQDGASKAARLAMSVPSHCPLLAEAAQILCADMAAIAARSPSGIYLSASAARRLRDPAAIKLDLAMNMAQQVHWSTTLRLAWESGARLALEMPGSSTLTNLVNSQWSDGMALACDTGRPDVLIDLALREQSSLH